FLDITTTVNLASASFAHTGFGSDWLDFDNDGDLDLFVANGAVQRYVRANGQVAPDYAQKNQLWRNDGKRFTNVSDIAFDNELGAATSRGAAFGDIDNDGDTDIVVTNKDGPARLYINQTAAGQWLGLELRGVRSNRDAIGAIVKLDLPDGRQIRRVVRRDGSYQSAHDPRVIIGLGALTAVPDVEISWPAGGRQRLENLTLRRFHVVVEADNITRP
ncbi:MAG: CRTAC1 family protein, partial [Gammaproteobacteria bacterium]|nr:CRTAC1 family protein [Gammaproteobacteria bacterium]